MSLILVKAPPPLVGGILSQGMRIGGVVEPGQPPPFLIPHCRQCGVPVERFTIDYVASPFYLPIQFTCHGRTSGLRIPQTEVIQASREGGLLWVFTETLPNARRTAR